MTDNWCKTCGDFTPYPDRHKCPPVFLVCVIGYHDETDPPEEWSKIHAVDAGEAAEKYAEIYDQDDHTMMQGEEIIALVCGPDKTISRFRVSGEAVKQFHAYEEPKP